MLASSIQQSEIYIYVNVAQSCQTLRDPLHSPWNSPGQDTGVSSLALLQGIFLAQGLNPDLLHGRWNFYQVNPGIEPRSPALQMESLPGEPQRKPLDVCNLSKQILMSMKMVVQTLLPYLMYRCESWIIKKANCRRIDAFELWSWRRQLRVPWKAGRSSQSVFKDINPGYSLEGLLLKVKLQYFGHLM